MSQEDFEVKEICGYSYKVYKLDPMVATDLLMDLGQTLAPTLGAMGGFLAKEKGDVISKVLDGGGGELGEGSSIDEAIEKALVGFFTPIAKAKQRELIEMLSKVTVVVTPEGKEPHLKDIFSKHFRGRLKALYCWLGFALKVQVSDFFEGTDIDISRFVRLAQAMSSSPNT